MTKATVYTQDGKKQGEHSLPEQLFSLPWHDTLVHQVVTGIANNRRTRTGSAHTKGRAEVRGGGRKPWRQKGTGRARHGSIRSPIWVGGGITFGPSKEKDYSVSINKKMRTKAFFIVLSEKLRNGALVFVDSFSVETPSTKAAAACVEKVCGAADGKQNNNCTIVFAENNMTARKSFMNLPGVKTIGLDMFNALDALSARKVVFIDSEKAVAMLEERGRGLLTDKVTHSVSAGGVV